MKRWYKYIKPYLPYFIIGPLCMIIEVAGEVVMPKLLSVVINLANEDRLTVSTSLSIMIAMALTAVVMMAGGVGGAYFGAKASVNFASDLRSEAFAKVQKFSFANIDKFSTGSLVTRLTNDITQIQNFVNMLLRMALRSPGMMIAALIMAISMKPSLSVVLAVTIPIMAIIIVFVISSAFPKFTRMQTKVDRLNSTVQENVTNVRVVKSFVREDFETEKFGKANRDLKENAMSAVKTMIILQPSLTLCMNLTTLAVIWLGGKTVVAGGMPAGDLSAFITYVTQILSSLMMITMIFMNASRAIASAKRVTEVLDEKPYINDSEAAFPEARVTEGKIEFRNVSYRYYKDSKDKVLDGISLTIEPCTTVGIIGSTGCGKTTLVSMISRLYDADEGQIFVDGVDVRDYSLKNLRDGIGIVLQKNTLFSGTISDNLRWGDENASEEEIISASEAAQAHKFVSGFGEGYETEIDQGGTNVSGGQKQRLCIARTLLKKPKVIILDDSTSAVDTATEAAIRTAFRTTLADSVKIIIAQRISSVMDADKIIVMDDGRITGEGTHAELLENNEEYREIYNSQMEAKEAM
ncbi:MAG: ABC transporter ATP-binding protein [Clostridia bacterium]|nr:ABC transporter ATP-binding protein [Clostridia bacterium]